MPSVVLLVGRIFDVLARRVNRRRVTAGPCRGQRGGVGCAPGYDGDVSLECRVLADDRRRLLAEVRDLLKRGWVQA
jgi:hypothetical protein